MSYVLVFTTLYFWLFPEIQLLPVLTIGCATMLITIPVIGYISDFIDRKIIYFGGLTLLFVLAIPYSRNDWAWGWLVLHDAGSCTRRHLGSHFPHKGHYSRSSFQPRSVILGLSVGYQVAAAIAGFGPLILDRHGGIIWPIPFGIWRIHDGRSRDFLALCILSPHFSRRKEKDQTLQNHISWI